MRIISKITDFYDKACAYGFDEKLIFNRNPEIMENINISDNQSLFKDYRFLSPKISMCELEHKKYHYKIYIYPFTVAFCGKIYPGLQINYQDTNGKEFKKSFYSIESYTKKIESLGYKMQKGKAIGYRFSREALNFKRLESYFKRSGSEKYYNFFIKRKEPIVIFFAPARFRTFNLYKNSSLKEFDFQSVFGSHSEYTTFQELSMFIGNMNTQNENNIMPIDDKVLAQQKGFDCYSFKKLPSKNKPKTC